MKKLIGVALFTLVLVGCSSSTDSQLTGTWIPNNNCPTELGDGVTFKEDGEIIVTDGEAYTKWEMNEEESIIKLSNLAYGTVEYNFQKLNETKIRITEDEVSWQRTCEFIKQ